MKSYGIAAAAALFGASLTFAATAAEPNAALLRDADKLADAVTPEVVSNRRYLHEHPELSNREVETGKFIAGKLREFGYEVQTGVAHNGVVAVLRGGKPGPVVALRSDMDALPVAEEVNLPFSSKVTTTYDGKDVGVMHACGHDAHMGILLGAAKVFSQMKDRLPGTVKLIFQPAEEGKPKGEEGGAELMVKEGVLTKAPVPNVIFGLHILTEYEVGQIAYRAGGLMASADNLTIVVKGKQTHGAIPWGGIDPIVTASQIVLGLQTIVSRQINITQAPAIVTIGKIDGGVRNNIVPESVTLKGTIRTLAPAVRDQVHAAIKRTAEDIAASAGASAEVSIGDETAYPVTFNDPKLTAQMRPTLEHLVAPGQLIETTPQTVAEDFSFYQQQIPGLFVFVGVRKPGASKDEYAPNHSPRFKVDESGLGLGVKTLLNLTLDYMTAKH